MILRHRDREVLRFEWCEPQGVRITAVNASAVRFLPLDFKGEASDDKLWKWLSRRVVPKHRHYIQTMLGNLGLARAGTRELIGISKLHRHYNLPESRLSKIEDFLQKRIAQIEEFGRAADTRLKASGKSGSVNPVKSESLAVQITGTLRADPFVTYVELSELLQIPPRTLAHKMKALEEAGEIRHVGAAKSGHWEVLGST